MGAKVNWKLETRSHKNLLCHIVCNRTCCLPKEWALALAKKKQHILFNPLSLVRDSGEYRWAQGGARWMNLRSPLEWATELGLSEDIVDILQNGKDE